MRNEWTGFVPGVWEKEIDVRDFIQKNYTPYDGDDAFLAGPTEDTKALWQQVLELSRAEREAGGVLDMDTRVISTITSHAAGYLDKEKETIVGFQTEKPFKRALMPYGGIRMAQKACEDNGYHVDPEVNHGIDTLITRSGAAVITEDSISNRVEKFPTTVLNQWTYHSRLYAAAKYCITQKDMDLVQLVSFGCGVDAITTDETREILQEGGKLYTQLKIDEITNLGAVNIRLRSLFAALDERDEVAAEKAE